MIKKVKASKSEKILLTFLILLFIFTFGSYYTIKNKCLFVDQVDIEDIKISDKKNIALMEIECGIVIIELYPKISPRSVERFKRIIKSEMYNGSTFYKVIENTLIQAGDLEFGHKDAINYLKVGSGNSGLGSLESEINDDFEFKKGSVALARNDQFNTEDSEFFIILKDIPLYNREYSPIG